MTLDEIFNNFFKKFSQVIPVAKFEKVKNMSIYPLFVIVFLIFFSFIYLTVSKMSNNKKLINKENLETVSNTREFINLKNYFFSKINSPYVEVKYIIKNNDSIERILKNFNIAEDDIKKISLNLKRKRLTNIYSGRKLNVVYKIIDKKRRELVNLVYPISNTSSIEIRRVENDFLIKENLLQLNKREVVVKNEIKSNLYKAATDGGVEANIIIEFARVFGFEVDFQRDIRKGDWFEILYEKFEDDNGKVRDTGKIIYASMYVNGEEINLYNFVYKGEQEYYDIKGKSITKSLMKTPINGARLSSSFGMRKHPILGYNKMHRGTDFAAPSGTPIMASGTGTVTRARWCGGGGNCVKIKHNSTYETVYAHMKSFAKGVKEGRKVKQGQIIGYVGSTGLSTGPHLHYEVIVNGKKVNSQRLKLPSGKILKGKAREKFELDRIKIDLKLSNLR